MGLDVYLYYCADLALAQAKEQTYSREYEALKQGGMTDHTMLRRALQPMAESLGLDEYGEATSREKIERDSEKYPEHQFKIGYFRSSYNESGLDRVLRAKTGWRLSRIFEAGETSYVYPNWERASAKALEALSRLMAALAESPFRATSVMASRLFESEMPVSSEAKALAVFDRERAKVRPADDPFSAYGNRDGEFIFSQEPLRVRGLIPGQTELGHHCVYVVYEYDRACSDWYLQALSIVAETCHYVMAQPDPEKYFLYWSS